MKDKERQSGSGEPKGQCQTRRRCLTLKKKKRKYVPNNENLPTAKHGRGLGSNNATSEMASNNNPKKTQGGQTKGEGTASFSRGQISRKPNGAVRRQ